MSFWGVLSQQQDPSIMLINENIANKLSARLLVSQSYAKYKFVIYSNSNSSEIEFTKNGLVLGKIDNRDSLTFSDKLLTCDNFCNNYTGNYTYIYYSAYASELQEIQILRSWDNKKSLFYYTSPIGITYFTNDIRILFFLGIKLELDSLYFKFLLHSHINTQNTPFISVKELLAGCYLDINLNKDKQNVKQSFCLDLRTKIENPTDTKDFFNEIIYNKLEKLCINSFSQFSNLILDYSGGLDSTFLLYTLKKISELTGQNLTAINFSSNYSNLADEESYCKMLCNKINIKLISFDHNQCLPFSNLHEFNLLPVRPSPELALHKRFKILSEFGNNIGDHCFINGEGGDHIFSCPPIVESLIDIIYDGNISSFSTKLKELYYIFRIPIFQLIKLFLKGAINPSILIQDIIHTMFDSYDEQEKYDQYFYKNHPYFKDEILSKKVGKVLQIINIYVGRLISNIDPRSNNLLSESSVIHPLLHQSLLTSILNIPTYENFSHGYDRYLVRKFLSKRIDGVQSMWRKDKGDISGLVQKGFQENISSIKELCLEGYLMKEGIITKKDTEEKIYRLLTGGLYEEYHIFLNIVGSELMIQSWKNSNYI